MQVHERGDRETTVTFIAEMAASESLDDKFEKFSNFMKEVCVPQILGSISLLMIYDIFSLQTRYLHFTWEKSSFLYRKNALFLRQGLVLSCRLPTRIMAYCCD